MELQQLTLTVRALIRADVRKRRRALSIDEQHHASIAVLKHLRSHPKMANAKRIALYLANDSELDPAPLLQWCWQQNKQVFLPVLHPFNGQSLLFLRYRQDSDMQANQFGILEPKLDVRAICPLEQLDLLLTPLVAFDDSGARLGMGGGFYDRTLANWFKKYQAGSTPTMYAIGLAHDCQRVAHIPCECWDIPLPEIITPGKIYHWHR